MIKIIYLIENSNEIGNQLIQIAFEKFYKLFIEDIQNIFKKHPINDSDESKIFWNNKKIPKEMKLNLKDSLWLTFLFSIIKIYADILNLDIGLIKNIAIFQENLKLILADEKKNNISEIINGSLITNPNLLFNKIIWLKKEIHFVKYGNKIAWWCDRLNKLF